MRKCSIWPGYSFRFARFASNRPGRNFPMISMLGNFVPLIALVLSSNHLYLSEPVYEALRKIAFDERIKIHDLAMEGIDAVLRKRGYPSAENLKAGMKA
jgi:hypothetical protein